MPPTRRVFHRLSAAGIMPRMVLQERSAELAQLREWLQSVERGAGRLVFLAGEAGVGKSALVREFCGDQRGVPVATGVCDPSLTPRPLAPIADIAAARGGALQSLVDEEQDTTGLFRAFLDELSAGRPAVVVIEDVHWADEATLDLLRYVGRRMEQTQSMLIATYRDDETRPGHPLRQVLGDLATSRSVSRMRLAPLSHSAVSAMAADHGVDADALHRQTGGNPFFVTEILAAGHGIPETVRDAVLARASRLESGSRTVLAAAAVVPTRVELSLLTVLTGAEGDDIDACVDAGMLVAGEPGTVAFRHELARVAIEDSLPPAQRLALHGRAATFLAAQDVPDSARVAYHAAAAANGALARHHAAEAARRADRLGAHRQAAALFATALRFADDVPEAARAELLEGVAAQGKHTGAVDEALDAATQAVELRRAAGDDQALAASLRILANAQWDAGVSRAAEDSQREAIALLEQHGDSAALAESYAMVTAYQMLTRRLPETLEWADRAIAVAERVGSSWALARALNAVGSMKVLSGLPGGRSDLERSMAVAQEAGLEPLVILGWCNLGSAAGEVREYPTAEPALQEAIRHATAVDDDLIGGYSTAWLARVQFEQGDWAAAEATAARLHLERPGSSPLTALTALTVLGRLAARRGAPEAGARLERAWRMAAGTGDLQRLWPVAAARAELAWLDHAPERIEGHVAETFVMAVRLGHRWAAGELGLWLQRAGAAREVPERCAEPYALQLAGRRREAAEQWQRIGAPYEAADALADSEDQGDLREALAVFDRLGAAGAAARVRHRLHQLGVRNVPRGPRPATAAHPAQLTPRETQILALLCEGLADAEIAQRLFISPKTVGHHVSAVLRKLGAASRGEAAAVARRRDLVSEDRERSPRT